jgi:hypothetical protein
MKNRRLIGILLGFAFALSPADRVSAFRTDRFERYGSELFQELGAFGVASKFSNLAEISFSLSLQRFDNFFDETATQRIDDIQMLNFRAMVPVSLGENWNLIGLPVVPLASNGLFFDRLKGTDEDYGFGDMTLMALLSPAASAGDFIWGAGSVLTLPTATSVDYGEGRWQAGPAAAGFYMGDNWLLGVLSQHRWSLTSVGDQSGAIQTTAIQSFLEYNLSDRSKIGVTNIILLNWNAKSENSSAFPFDLDKARTVSVGKLPVKFTVDGFFEVNARWRF